MRPPVHCAPLTRRPGWLRPDESATDVPVASSRRQCTTSAGSTVDTSTVVVPDLPPPVAVTSNGPPSTAPALNTPVEEIVPPPVTAHVNAGCVPSALPNW